MRLNLRKAARAEAELEVSQVATRHEIPIDTPPDLRDEMPHFLAPASGSRISSRLLTSDVAVGRMSPVTAILLFGTFAVLLGIVSKATYAPLFFWLTLLAWSGFLALVYLLRISRFSAHLHGLALPGDGDFALQIRAALARKTAQCERAKTDGSEFWVLGNSTHRIAGISGADRGQALGLTARDLSTHLLVIGATGSGKTSGVLRPLATWWASRRGAHGLLVMDGKGDLPREFEGKLPGFKLLVPGRDAVDLLATLEPHDICLALAQKSEDGDFWSQSASELLYQAAVIAQHASARVSESGAPLTRYDLVSISRILSDAKYRSGLCIELSRGLDPATNRTLFRALSFFVSGWEPEKSNTQAGVLSTASSWVNNLLRHPALLSWAAPEGNEKDRIQIAQVLDGARYGLDVPEYRYGDAAAAVTALLRAQVYRAAKNRGSSAATQCLVVIDEAALALGPLEAQILPVARSLGLSFACATQNIEQFYARFGEAGALALVDQFRSLVQLVCSQKTAEYARLRAGNGITVLREPSDAPAFSLAIAREATGDARTWAGAHEAQASTIGLARKILGMRDQNGQEKPAQKLLLGPLVDEQLALGDGEALCVLNRASALRVETAQLNRMF